VVGLRRGLRRCSALHVRGQWPLELQGGGEEYYENDYTDEISPESDWERTASEDGDSACLPVSSPCIGFSGSGFVGSVMHPFMTISSNEVVEAQRILVWTICHNQGTECLSSEPAERMIIESLFTVLSGRRGAWKAASIVSDEITWKYAECVEIVRKGVRGESPRECRTRF
jgi:hypothetical protein